MLDPASGRTNNNIQRPSECLLLAQSGHRAAEFQCLLLGVKRTSHGHALMSAGRRSLKGRAARKRTASKKIADTGGVSFLRFRFQATGCTGASYAVFQFRPDGQNSLLFFQCGLPGDTGGRASGRRSRWQRRSSVGVHDDSASSKALASLRSRVSKPSVNQS